MFKDNVEHFVRVLFFLDEEDKAYKDNSDQPYAPQWKSLKDTLKMDKAFREFAKRLSDETRRVENDQEGYQNFYLKRLLGSLLTSKSGVWERSRSIIPHSLHVAVISLANIVVHHWSTVMTAVDDVVNLVDKAGGTVVMVALVAVYLTYSAYVNIRRWWRDEISGKRCIKNLLDTTFTIGAGIAGGVAGAAIGTLVAGPFGAAIGSIVGGWVSAAGIKYLSDVMTRRMFGLPKEEAVENAYRYLGVEMTDPNAEINTAFRKLCLKHHPDKGGNQDDFFIVQCNMAIIRQARGEF